MDASPTVSPRSVSPAVPDRAGVVAPPPILVAVSVAVGLGLHALAPVPLGSRGATAIVAAVLFAAAGALSAAGALAMRRGRTAIRPSLPSSALVTDGPFRWTRNPLYVSLLLLHVAAALAANGAAVLVPLVPTAAILRWGVVGREERYMERLFGAEYAAYRARVRRWF